MAFEPISWMVSYSLKRVADRILQTSECKKITKKLRKVVQEWAENNNPPIPHGTLDTIFCTKVDESKREQFKDRSRLSETILSEDPVPSKEVISNALLERWGEIRDVPDRQDLEKFFQLSRDEAAEQFDGLAKKIRKVLQQNDGIFKVATLGRLDEINEKVDHINSRAEASEAEDDSPVFTVPYRRHNCFEGRKDILAKLRETLVSGNTAALSQVIRGLGGIGKTQTAVEYAYEHKEQYEAVLWIKAASELDIRQSMAGAAKRLKLPHDETKPEEAVRALMQWLEKNSDWLLIFDNADNPELLKSYIPKTDKGHILLTSRASVFDMLGILSPIELPLFSIEDATKFLIKRTGRDESNSAEVESAQELANELGLFPLALEQAGAYIQELRLSFANYLKMYRKRRLEFLERGLPKMGDYDESVATTWVVNFEQVETESVASADILRLSAFLDPDNIPFELLLFGVSATDCSLAETISKSDNSELAIREVLRPLTRFSLVTIGKSNDSYDIHRLVQEAVKHSLGESACRSWAERTVRMVREAFPSGEFENWGLCERLVSHAVVATTQADVLANHTENVSILANNAALFLQDQAQYADAEPLFKRAIEICRVILGKNHPNFAICLNNLADLYRELGRYNKAELLYKQSMEIRRVALGEQHPDYAQSLSNLATLYEAMGRYKEAEPLYKQAMEINRTALGEKHSNFATDLNNLAVLYGSMGRHEKVESLFKQSIKIARETKGEQHPSYAARLNNLAEHYRMMVQYDEAEPLYLQSMEIRRVALGEQHPDYAQSLNNLAILYKSLGRHYEAEPLYKQSIEIMRVALGEQHPDFASSLNNLGALYRTIGRHDEAEPLMKQSMEIIRVALGEQHPNFVTVRSNLAGLYRAMGRHKEAEELENKTDS